MCAWSALSVLPGRRGTAVVTALQEAGIETYRPTRTVIWPHRGRTYERQVPLLLNYVLARFEPGDWHQVRSLPGVVMILDGHVTDEEVQALRVLPPPGVTPSLWEGQPVQLGSGIGGTVVDSDGMTARVKIALLGREFVLQLPEALCDPAVNRGPWSGRRRNRRRQGRPGKRLFPAQGVPSPFNEGP